MKSGDKYLWGVLIALAGSVFLISSYFKLREAEPALGTVFAQVRSGGEIVCRVQLDAGTPEERTFTSANTPAGSFNVVRFERDRARVVSANCPDKLCVKRGWVSRDDPHPAVCLPHHFSLEIVPSAGKIERDDAVSY